MQTWQSGHAAQDVVWYRLCPPFKVYTEPSLLRSRIWQDDWQNDGVGEQRPARNDPCEAQPAWYNGRPPAIYRGTNHCGPTEAMNDGGVDGQTPLIVTNDDGSADCCDGFTRRGHGGEAEGRGSPGSSSVAGSRLESVPGSFGFSSGVSGESALGSSGVLGSYGESGAGSSGGSLGSVASGEGSSGGSLAGSAGGSVSGSGSGATGSSGLPPGSHTVSCCSGVVLPTTIHCTLSQTTVTCGCILGSYPINWDGSKWSGTFTVCSGQTITIEFTTGCGFSLFCGSVNHDITFVSMGSTCSPFNRIYALAGCLSSCSCCGGTGLSGRATITL